MTFHFFWFSVFPILMALFIIFLTFLYMHPRPLLSQVLLHKEQTREFSVCHRCLESTDCGRGLLKTMNHDNSHLKGQRANERVWWLIHNYRSSQVGEFVDTNFFLQHLWTFMYYKCCHRASKPSAWVMVPLWLGTARVLLLFKCGV